MQNFNRKIFLSYAKEDFEMAERIYSDLTQAGLEVWFDKVSLLPGQNWKIEIKKAIKNSWRFLALLSSKSVTKRGYIQKELKEAIEILDEIPESDILIVPVRIEDCEPPERLKELHWVDLFESYEKGILQILRVLKTENYRDFPISLSIYDAKDMIKKFDFFHFNWNKNGRGFVKQYESQIVEGDNIIIDNGPGLIWQQEGSPTRLDFHESENWIVELNSKSIAGFKDWRKPTLEEAMSLMEAKKENSLFMNQIFDGEKNSIWTSDTINDQNNLFAWVVQFDMGICKIDDINNRHYIKAVRSQPSSYLISSEHHNLIEHYKILNSASIDIQSSKTEKEAVDHFFSALKLIGYTDLFISIINQTTKKIEGKFVTGSKWNEIFNESIFDLNDNDISAISIRERKTFLIENCYSDSRCNQQLVRKANIQSQLLIPIVVNEETIGIFQVDLTNKKEILRNSREIQQQKIELLKLFVNQLEIVFRSLQERASKNLIETLLIETAHEFRSPLHNIIAQLGGLKQLLPEDYKGKKEIIDIFNIIVEEIQRANRQMQNVLLLNQSTGLAGFRFEDAFIQDVIQQCVKFYRLKALERGISIIILDNIKKLPKFKFDNQKLEQVINNLLDNAIKYSHFNRYIQIYGKDDGSKIHVSFWDKGLGIPEAEYEFIFKGYARSTILNKKRYIPGTGLGLKISKEIIEAHGGEINVKSTPFFNDPEKISKYDGYDTIFTIILPKKRK